MKTEAPLRGEPSRTNNRFFSRVSIATVSVPSKPPEAATPWVGQGWKGNQPWLRSGYPLHKLGSVGHSEPPVEPRSGTYAKWIPRLLRLSDQNMTGFLKK